MPAEGRPVLLSNDRVEQVVALAVRLVAGAVETPEQADLLTTPFRAIDAGGGVEVVAPRLAECVHLPLLVHAAVTGEDEPAIPLAVAAVLLYLGIDLLDDIMDGDPSPLWPGVERPALLLAGATLISALPQRLVASLELPAATRTALQATLADGLLIMAAGQQQDLDHAGNAWVTARAAEEAIARKSGGLTAMLAAMAAQVGGASHDVVQAYSEIGAAWGAAGQLRSDCADLFDRARGKDFQAGARTLPLALWLENAAPSERRRRHDLLIAARSDATARQKVRDALVSSGLLTRCATVIALRCQDALAALDRAQPREPSGGILAGLIRATGVGSDDSQANQRGSISHGIHSRSTQSAGKAPPRTGERGGTVH